MASFQDAYAALDEYRSSLQSELPQAHSTASAYSAASAAAGPALRGGFSAFATPMSNVHATGVGVRLRQGKVVPDDFVLKVYVFDKQDPGVRTPTITGKSYHGIARTSKHLRVKKEASRKALHRSGFEDGPASRNRTCI